MSKLENCDVYPLCLSCQCWLLPHCSDSPVFLWLQLEQPDCPQSVCPDNLCFLPLHHRLHGPMNIMVQQFEIIVFSGSCRDPFSCVFSTLWMTAGSKTLQGGAGTGGMGVFSVSSSSVISFSLWERLSFRPSRRALAPSSGFSESLQFWAQI